MHRALAGADERHGTGHLEGRTGAYRLAGVPAGSYSVVVNYLGHGEQRADVTVTAGQTLSVDVELARTSFSETVQVVAAPIGEGQAAALNQQRTALNITNVVSAT